MTSSVLVHSGYLLVKVPSEEKNTIEASYSQHSSAAKRNIHGLLSRTLKPQPQQTSKVPEFDLHERYCELYGRKFFMYKEKGKEMKLGQVEIRGFCQWIGDNSIVVDSYGLEVKTSSESSLYIVASNRLDLESWCKAFLAVLDPNSTAAQDLNKRIRQEKKKEKKRKKEIEENKRLYLERLQKQEEREREMFLKRQDEIEQMTPLERIDGLGTLDEDTTKMLEMRKQRLNRRHKANIGRIGRDQYIRRLEEGAGGKIANVLPLQRKQLDVTSRQRVRYHPPPPGQFIGMTGPPLPLDPPPPPLPQHSTVIKNSRTVSSVSGKKTPIMHNSSSEERNSSSSGSDSESSEAVTPPSSNGSSAIVVKSGSRDETLPRDQLATLLAKTSIDKHQRNVRLSMDKPLSEKGEPQAVGSEYSNRRISYSRKKQLSDEGKGLFKKAIEGDRISENAAARDRRGLFDDSSSDDDHRNSLSSSTSRFSGASRLQVPAAPFPQQENQPTYIKKGNRDIVYSSTTPLSEPQSFIPSRSNSQRPFSLEIQVKYLSNSFDSSTKSIIYTFEWLINGRSQKISMHYHEMEKIHNRLGNPIPKFPSRHLLRNPNKPENIQKRAQEFIKYFKELLALKRIQTNALFHSEYKLSPSIVNLLIQRETRTRDSHSVLTPQSIIASTRLNSVAAVDNVEEMDKVRDNEIVKDQSNIEYVEKRRTVENFEETINFDVKPPFHVGVPTERETLFPKKISHKKADDIITEIPPPPPPSPPSRPSPPSSPAVIPSVVSPVAPQRHPMFAAGRADLLSQIRKGTQLTRRNELESEVEINSPPQQKSPEKISGNTEEKSTSNNLTIGDAISNAMASRRIHVEDEEKHDSDEDSEDWE